MAMQTSPHSESARSEQIISQLLLKTLHIILDSRISSLLRPHEHHSGDLVSSSRIRKSDKWFHLALGDRPSALDNLNFWHRNVMDPMIIDIILVHEGSVETVIERWVVQYETPLRSKTPSPPQSTDGAQASYKKMYKKSILLLRSLYSMMRLLPAYKIFRQLNSSNQTYNFDVIYKVSSFGEPFSRDEEHSMKHYSFVPVEAYPGCLSVSVTYHPTLAIFNLESLLSLPPQIISDYVGSPATDRMKFFPSSEMAGQAISFPSRGIHPPPSPFQRPHSWTSGLHRGAGAHFNQNNPFSGSPPAYRMTPSDYSSSPPDIYSHRGQSYRVPVHAKGMSFDDYQLSPPFSPSTTPSPPAYFPTSNSFKTRLRSESAPVNIPLPMMGRNSKYLTPSASDPNRHFLPPMSPRSTKPDHSSQESPSGSRSFRKMDALRAAELHSGVTNFSIHSGSKALKDSKDDSGRFSGLVSSSVSPRIGFSRSSSRLSFQDDLDECDFSCPFAVDDVDTSDSQSRSRYESSSQAFSSTRKSQDAEIGELVHMLRTAPPLRQDSSSYSSQTSRAGFGAETSATSEYFASRRTADALEELRSYREMKDLLISQSGSRIISADRTAPASFTE
ncbi:hypothetical protein GIB67_033254 [Kingdonia uniflora]|uniref:Autophagy-related protein 13 N-terminal domain-containing protein n=1 Tax=Kingdonia uniflora TaxID=39325 RepID=A0A7J7MPB7_9MAGN|nr:hypothetical protein GIB67_033254 [Kingdonia uniflora]